MFGITRKRSQLLGLIMVGTILPALVVGSYTILESRKTLVSVVADQMKFEGSESGSTINLFLDNVSSDIKFLSKNPPVQGIVRARENKGIDPTDGSSYESWTKRMGIIFVSFVEARPHYDQIRYLDENGNELVRVNKQGSNVEVVTKSQLQNKSSADYFTETMTLQNGEIYVSPINLNQENGQIEKPLKPVIRYGIPIFNAQGDRRGIIVANILANDVIDIADNEELQEKFQQEFIVINEKGDYLQHPDDKKEWGSDLENNETISKDEPEIAKEILSNEQGLIDTSKALITYQKIFPNAENKSNPFFLIYKTPKAEVLAPINKVTTFSGLIAFILVFTILTICYFILQTLVKSLSEMTGFVSAFSNELMATIEEQERISHQQSASVQQTTVTMDQLNASSQQSAQQADYAVSSAQRILIRTGEGNQAVETTLAEMSNVKTTVEQIAAQIFNLSKQTEQIASVSSLVSDIANQTNMLALNAAVEAVRAGESGKGFAVVASEIRKLADESQKSSYKISSLVEEIQRQIKLTVNSTQDGQENVDKSVKIAQNTASVLADVANAMNEIVSNSQQIALTSKQQAIATQQVTETMTSLNQGAKEAAVGINQTKEGTVKLNEAAVKLQEVI